MKERLGLVLVVMLGVVGTAALIVGVILVSDRQDRLCQVIYGFVAQSDQQIGKPGSPSYEFYRRLSPVERRRAIRKAHQESRRLLKALDFCSAPTPASSPTPRARKQERGRPTSRAPSRRVHRSPLTTSVLSEPSQNPPPAPHRTQSPRQPERPASPESGSESPPPPPAGAAGPLPGQHSPAPHGHEHSLTEQVCDQVDRLLTNAC